MTTSCYTSVIDTRSIRSLNLEIIFLKQGQRITKKNCYKETKDHVHHEKKENNY